MAEHHVERVHVEPLRAPIEGALYDCITQHGPITERWVPSAAKRVRGQLSRLLRDREDTVRSLATERTRLRRHVARLEDALRPFCRPDHPPTVEDVRHACRSLYGPQPWIDAFAPPWAAGRRVDRRGRARPAPLPSRRPWWTIDAPGREDEAMADDEGAASAGPQEVVATHRSRREALHEAAAGLDADLRSLEANGTPDRDRVTEVIAGVVAPLQEHVRGANRPGGILAQVIDAAPWLASRARQLGREHDALLERAQALARQAAAEDAAVDGLLREARELAAAMTRHVHRGTTLILDAYMLDIPDGD